MFQRTIIAWLRDRIHKRNKNNLIVICGSTGSGKSWRSLRIAELIDDNFTISRVVFSVEELLRLLNKDKIKKGDCVIFEEGGVGASNRNWYSILNKAMVFLFQTMRHRNFTLIMNVPSMSYIDNALRPLFHVYIETLFIDEKKDSCLCKVWRIQHNPYEGKSYTKYFGAYTGDGGDFDATEVWICPPQTVGLIDDYEKKKTEFTTKLYAELEENIELTKEHDATEWNKPKDIKDIVKEIVVDYKNYVKVWQKKEIIDKNRISAEYNVGIHTAKRIKAAVESKIQLN